jgi:hypothetical protein
VDSEPGLTRGNLDLLREYKRVHVKDGVRFLVGERVATSAGVAAGIDLALALAARTWNEDLARQIVTNLEWQSRAQPGGAARMQTETDRTRPAAPTQHELGVGGRTLNNFIERDQNREYFQVNAGVLRWQRH